MMVLLKNKVFISFLVLNIIAFAVWFFAIGFINNMENSYQENLAKLAQVEKDRQSAQSIRNLLRETSEERKSLEDYFVDEDNVIVFLEAFESIGDNSGLKIDLSSVDQGEDRLELSFQASGDFSDIYNFVLLIENMPFKVHFEEMNIRYVVDVLEDESTLREWRGSFVLVLDSFVSKNKAKESKTNEG